MEHHHLALMAAAFRAGQQFEATGIEGASFMGLNEEAREFVQRAVQMALRGKFDANAAYSALVMGRSKDEDYFRR